MARRPDGGSRAVALVAGASRRRGIGAAIALSLARAGWDVATTCWRAYDQRMPSGGSARGLREPRGLLCSVEGGWINGQLVRSDGGFR